MTYTGQADVTYTGQADVTYTGQADVTYTGQAGPPTTDRNCSTLMTQFYTSLCIQVHEEGAGVSWRDLGFMQREKATTFQY